MARLLRGRMLVALCAAGLAGLCSGADSPCATGLLIPPHRRNISDSAALQRRAKALHSASAKSSDSVSDMPTSWDSREKGWIGDVKNQGDVNSCWAFASYETLETQMRRLGLGDWDFSEKNMVNLHGLVQVAEKDGLADFAEAYLLRWGGAVAETNDAYIATLDDWTTDSVPRNPPVHVQDVVWIPARTGSTDNDALKRAIMEYGAVAVSMYGTKNLVNPANGAYYCSYANVNHLVTVIGWDDNYSNTNFLRKPAGDGAWLVKNSWGVEKGDEGYLHVSYYDTSFHRASWCYGTVFLPAADGQDYSAVYGYDRLGRVAYDLTGDGCPIGAIFTASSNERLAAVGLYSCEAPLDFRVSVYTNLPANATDPTQGGTLAFSQTGRLTHLGFSTISLSSDVPLAKGEKFSVVFENLYDAVRYFSVCAPVSEYSDDFTPVDDVTFYCENGVWSNSVSKGFNDIYGRGPYFGNICLKAYTRSAISSKDSGPAETADGSPMCSDLAAAAPSFYAQTSQTFGAFANIVGDNSHSLWFSWMAGLDPSDPASDFILSLTLSNGTPSLTWSPDTIPNRNYSIYGKRSLSDDLWVRIPEAALPTTDARFFKVEISPK